MSQTKIPMTKKQNEIFHFMKEYYQEKGEMPLQSEIADHFNILAMSTIQFHLKGMHERGWIRRLPGRKRAIALNLDGLHPLN
jgi:SOS-response transcriptional repressor LexA